MKILFLAHRVPFPPDKGDRMRAYHELELLAEKHEIDLFSLASSPEQIANSFPLRSLCRRMTIEVVGRAETVISCARALADGDPLSFAWFHSKRLAQKIQDALWEEKYDVIFVFCSSMMQYVPDPAPCPIVLDFVDADSAKWAQYATRSLYPMRWLYGREARCLSAREREFVQRASCSIAVSAKEAKLLSGEGNIKIIGIGANQGHRSPGLPSEVAALQRYILFMGQMDYRPNVDAVSYFAEQIWPLIRNQQRPVRFVIAGRNPTRKVQRLAQIPGIVVTGTVSDIGIYLRGAQMVVAPFRISQGVHTKILEAIAEGVPVICSPQASEGLPEAVRRVVVVKKLPREFADSICSFLDDSSLCSAFAKLAESVREDLRWDRVLQPIDELLHEFECGRKPALKQERSAAPVAL